ncbi:MAG TPA: DUF427 domain-containing protein [Hypericibacter adhaerens]|uniref:DUF427 domain-containing protein n=1 Tax=Hypericibacter adhaerens TaxID=2602016 RepID=UPI001CD961B6|nr:DUF427 domain-containing protein [Hypericibacter adhaerens]HWA44844.1 DUF427 domain-containing protein [Hypericibacter adhaerens]
MANAQAKTKTMKLPGPDHPITIEPNPRPVRVTWNGQVIAETKRALTLQEAAYDPVQYIPRADVKMALLARTDHHSYCPYKGDASYYSIEAGGRRAENAVWSYEAPYDAMASIKGHLAFYPDRVSIEELPG